MKTIVTHVRPDLDAITSVWLVLRYLPGWEEATIAFVPAGSTLNDADPDTDPDIIHTDTGLGKFDHHQTNDYTSATKKVFKYLVAENHIPSDKQEAIERIVNHVTDIDHFAEVTFPEPTSDRYEFSLYQIIEGLHAIMKHTHEAMGCVFSILDGIEHLFIAKIRAQEEIGKGYSFTSKWGKSLAMESKNEESMKLALKMGYKLVIRKDPEKGNVRIKTYPDPKLDLTAVYEKVVKADPKATWFLHSSKNILLNGSSKGPNMTPTTLPIKKVIEIIKGI
jgi:hypothetical protein